MSNCSYLLDTNVFIDAFNKYYSFDFGMVFWNFLEKKASQKIICSIAKVLYEIKQREDALKEWTIKHFDKYFHPTNDNTTLKAYKNVAVCVKNKTKLSSRNDAYYTPNALNAFLAENKADAWLIAYAYSHSQKLCIVTLEKPGGSKKVSIPDVCKDLGIPCIDTFQMLRNLNFKF